MGMDVSSCMKECILLVNVLIIFEHLAGSFRCRARRLWRTSSIGSVTWVGRTSIEVEICVEAEDLLTGVVTHTNSAHFVYVALNDERRPTAVPPLVLETEEERQRFAEGEERQATRLERARRRRG